MNSRTNMNEVLSKAKLMVSPAVGEHAIGEVVKLKAQRDRLTEFVSKIADLAHARWRKEAHALLAEIEKEKI